MMSIAQITGDKPYRVWLLRALLRRMVTKAPNPGFSLQVRTWKFAKRRKQFTRVQEKVCIKHIPRFIVVHRRRIQIQPRAAPLPLRVRERLPGCCDVSPVPSASSSSCLLEIFLMAVVGRTVGDEDGGDSTEVLCLDRHHLLDEINNLETYLLVLW